MKLPAGAIPAHRFVPPTGMLGETALAITLPPPSVTMRVTCSAPVPVVFRSAVITALLVTKWVQVKEMDGVGATVAAWAATQKHASAAAAYGRMSECMDTGILVF